MHSTWVEVKQMKKAIVKEWDLTGITRAFVSNFQIITMAINTTKNLFNAPTAKEHDDVWAEEVDSDLPLSEVIDDCLQPNVDILRSTQQIVLAPVGAKQRTHAQVRARNRKTTLQKKDVTTLKKRTK